MASYKIRSSFKSPEYIDFRDHKTELQNAIDVFNISSKERKKNAVLTLHDITENDFTVVLKSPEELAHPSKALNKFSQSLAQEPTIRKYVVNGNQLVKSLEISPYVAPHVEMTNGRLLEFVVKLVHNTDVCVNVAELEQRRNLVVELKKLVQNSGLI